MTRLSPGWSSTTCPIRSRGHRDGARRPATGVVGGYVWDYSGEMQMMRFFWEAVAATDADAATHDPRAHYDICRPEPLADLFRAAGLGDVVVEAIDLPMRFRDLDDFWMPHTMSGPAAAQRYVATLDDDRKRRSRRNSGTRSPSPGTARSI